jgi:zinc protease
METVDRTRRPPSLPPPVLRLPDVEKRTLANGLSVWLVERHRLPLLSVQLLTRGGSEREPADRSGIASLAAMLYDAGIPAMDLLAIARRLEEVGASMHFASGHDATYGWLSSLSHHIDRTLPVFADTYTRPTFPEAEFQRIRRRRKAALAARRDQPASIATRAFLKEIYGAVHPYGQDEMGSEESIERMVRGDAVSVHHDICNPRATTLLVVGDITMAQLLPKAEKAFAHWTGQAREDFVMPPIPEPGARRIVLIDKPGAPQSEIRIGYPALARTSPDFFAVQLMNRILGGQFSSRINMNLRERHGYTYGARTSFHFLRDRGPFMASGAFVTEHTADSVRELLVEIGQMGSGGMSAEELAFSRKGAVGSFSLSFETSEAVAMALHSSVFYGLPDDYLGTYLSRLEEVTLDDIRRVSAACLRPEMMSIVVVGDAAAVRGQLEKLDLGPVVMKTAGE